MTITTARRGDLPAILQLQYLAYQSEAELVGSQDIPPLKQTLAEVEAEFDAGVFLKAEADGELVGSVRGRAEGGTLYVGKLIVRPEHQGQGIGTALLAAIEAACPQPRCELFTSDKSRRNLTLYQRVGYVPFQRREVAPGLVFVYLEKQRGGAPAGG